MARSALVHLFAAELAAHLQLAAQLHHHVVAALQALLSVRVIGQPATELLVERGVLGPRALPSCLDEALVGAESDVFHRFGSANYTTIVYTMLVHGFFYDETACAGDVKRSARKVGVRSSLLRS